MSAFGGFRTMWVVAMFDLPTDTPTARRAYATFRKSLLEDGFVMLQYSVYARHCPSEENVTVHEGRIRGNLPPAGEVRVVSLTDRQFGRMKVFHGKKRRKTEGAPEQISLF